MFLTLENSFDVSKEFKKNDLQKKFNKLINLKYFFNIKTFII
jgi:hypothetical protein